MKKIIYIIMFCLLISGCTKESAFEDSKTYSTVYPIKYASDYLYSKYSKVSSIYPNEINLEEYTLTKKQKSKYSDCETFIYSGLADEGEIARDFLNLNNKLQIIDATKGMNINYNVAELWLDPSNYLMLARNIKESLIDYNDNLYVSKDIEKKYDSLKETISELDVMFYNLGKNGNFKTLLISNNLFTYLNKYSIQTISLDPSSDALDKAYTTAKSLIASGDIKYIYTIKDEVLNESITKLINDYEIERIEINTMANLTNEEAGNSETYITLMKKIIDEYKKELYK